MNLIGTLSLFGEHEHLEIRELDGSCTQTQVIAYLETLAERCQPEQLTVVVLDNAPFHKAAQLNERRALWGDQGLYLRYLPAYSPQLVLDKTAHRKGAKFQPSGPVRNLIESVWRKLKGFLMPRRCYDTLEQLQDAVRLALKALNAVTI